MINQAKFPMGANYSPRVLKTAILLLLIRMNGLIRRLTQFDSNTTYIF